MKKSQSYPTGKAAAETVLLEFDFTAPEDLTAFSVEQMEGGRTTLQEGKLVIDDHKGATVWLRQKLKAPYVIDYTVTASSKGRVSDINCFWNAADPQSKQSLIENEDRRSGMFKDYHALHLYYVGMGGHDNSRTRFRRYNGEVDRPLVPEHDLSSPNVLLEPDTAYHIQIRAEIGRTQYIRDGRVIFEFHDPEPYTEGYFGFRTVNSHLEIENFRVTRPSSNFLNITGVQSQLGAWGISPESPDGSRITYVTYKEIPEDRWAYVPGALWVAKPDGSEARKITEIGALNNHDGAHQYWVSNETIAFSDGDQLRVMNVKSGEEVLPPVRGVERFGQDAFDGKVLFSTVDASHPSLVPGMHELDTRNGKIRTVLTAEEAKTLPLPNDLSGAEGVVLYHPQYSTDGSHIGVGVTDINAPKVGAEPHRFIISCKADGSDPVVFGRKPLHWFWYDEDTFAGHDGQVEDGQPNDRSLRRWSRSAGFIETLAPPGNHIGWSPDRQWFASENIYGSDPIRLWLHAKGEEKNHSSLLVQSSRPDLVWTLGQHMNPAFSRDGKRLYFNMPTSTGGCQIAAVSLQRYLNPE